MPKHNRPQAHSLAAPLALFLMLGAGNSESGEVYRWNDASGNPVASDKPPPGTTPFTKILWRSAEPLVTATAKTRPAASQSGSQAQKESAADEPRPKRSSNSNIPDARCVPQTR